MSANNLEFSTIVAPLAAQYKTIIEQRDAIEAQRKALANSLKAMFEQFGVKTFTGDGFQLTYAKGGTYYAADEKRVRQEYPDVWEACAVLRSSGDRLVLTNFQDFTDDGRANE